MEVQPLLTKSSTQVLEPARQPSRSLTLISANCGRCTWDELELEGYREVVQGEDPPCLTACKGGGEENQRLQLLLELSPRTSQLLGAAKTFVRQIS